MPLSPKDFPGLAAVIQARVSKAGKHKSERSPKEQIAWGRTECARFGWNVCRVIDEGRWVRLGTLGRLGLAATSCVWNWRR